MTLIKSISGIRGTIGGKVGENLTPLDTVKFAAAYGTWLKQTAAKEYLTVVVGRDARISGKIISALVTNTLAALGIKVIDIGLATTPTVEIVVTEEDADGGIILTASHNPKQWNALKLLNCKGEFLSAVEGEKILQIADNENFNFTAVEKLGEVIEKRGFTKQHISKIVALPLVDIQAIKEAEFTIAIDCVNSVGALALPELLRSLGVKKIVEVFCTPNGDFQHNPEPLPENLTKLSQVVVEKKANLGFAVDPDVDRLSIVSEDGSMFGEEYTLVAIADYVLQHKKGNTVSNLSSSRALSDVTLSHGGQYAAAAVGEVNVVEMMKKTNAIIGGEGNGGIILPELHYGRDALVGIALFLTALAKKKIACSELRKSFPSYFISKNKIELNASINVDVLLSKIAEKYTTENQQVTTIDGVKIDFQDSWVHLRKSNTEPIIRIYAEAKDEAEAKKIAEKMIAEIKNIIAD